MQLGATFKTYFLSTVLGLRDAIILHTYLKRVQIPTLLRVVVPLEKINCIDIETQIKGQIIQTILMVQTVYKS